MNEADLQALWVSIQLALVSVCGLLLVGIPLAWWLARSPRWWKAGIEALIALPLVLPPTVLGFYLLLMLGRSGPLVAMGLPALAFTFSGLVIGSMVHSLPFVIQPLINNFRAIDPRLLEAAATLGATRSDAFWSVVMPNARAGLLSAAVLGFAHTMGEFGVVLMIGGSMAGSTKVASIAIYEHVENMDYAHAHGLAAVLLITSLCLLLPVYLLEHRRRKRS